MTPAAARAAAFVETIASVEAHPANAPAVAIIGAARKIAADLRREREGASRSGIPLTRLAR